MAKTYKASYIYGSSDNEPNEIGTYDTQESAIEACINFAKDDDELGGDEIELASQGLAIRGYYCCGYSTLILFVE